PVEHGRYGDCGEQVDGQVDRCAAGGAFDPELEEVSTTYQEEDVSVGALDEAVIEATHAPVEFPYLQLRITESTAQVLLEQATGAAVVGGIADIAGKACQMQHPQGVAVGRRRRSAGRPDGCHARSAHSICLSAAMARAARLPSKSS